LYTSILAAIVITLTPLLLVLLIPSNLPEFISLGLVGFAVGTLLGDVFLHIIPHTFTSAASESEGVFLGLAVSVGIVGFIVLDKIIRGLSGGHHHHHSNDHETHSKKHDHLPNVIVSDESSSTSFQFASQDGLRKRNTPGATNVAANSKISYATTPKQLPGHDHDHHHVTSSSGYLTVIANILHTVSDGFTLAVAHFQGNPAIVFSTTLAIFLHEVPHKIGDFAVMRKSGFTRTRALVMQLVLTIGTYIGVGLGIYLNSFATKDDASEVSQKLSGLEKWVLPATAGGLLYTACVGILPEILESKGFFSFIISLGSIFNGIILMASIALSE
jgi:solute carrier family 39 (zinc transporter), member 7